MVPPLNAQVFSLPLETTWSQSNRIFGLGDDLSDALVANRPLKEWSPAIAPPADPVTGPCFLVAPDLWVSPQMWSNFSVLARQQNDIVQLACAASGPCGLADPLRRIPRDAEGRLRFQLFFVPENVQVSLTDHETLAAARGMDVTGIVRTFRIPVDPNMGHDGHIELQWSNTLCSPVAHWSELLRTNLLAIGCLSLSTPPMRRLVRFLAAAVRAMSFNMDRIRKHLNTIGKDCRIHPSAIVEGCRISDGVEIGPGAIVRGCVVGPHARIESQAICDLSVIAEHATIQRRAMVNVSVVYPKARVGGILQFGLAGKESTSKLMAVGTDMRLQGPVRVETPSGLTEVDLGYQGVCFGPQSFVGSGVWIAPGRVIPRGAQIARPPEAMVLKP